MCHLIRLLSVDNTCDQRAYCDVTGTEKEKQSQPPGVCKIYFPVRKVNFLLSDGFKSNFRN